MKEKDIDPDKVFHITNRPTSISYDPDNLDSVRGSQRYILVSGFAWYRQHNSTGCSRTWASVYSWCILDLRKQKTAHRYGQECRTCGGKGIPIFDNKARRRIAEYACQKHLYRTKREQRPAVDLDMTDLSGQREGPHDFSKCDMCKLLGRPCNIIKPSSGHGSTSAAGQGDSSTV